VNFELIKDVKGSFCDLFNVTSQYLSGETEENHENSALVAVYHDVDGSGIIQIHVHTFFI
jgi:hypothetical protein